MISGCLWNKLSNGAWFASLQIFFPTFGRKYREVLALLMTKGPYCLFIKASFFIDPISFLLASETLSPTWNMVTFCPMFSRCLRTCQFGNPIHGYGVTRLFNGFDWFWVWPSISSSVSDLENLGEFQISFEVAKHSFQCFVFFNYTEREAVFVARQFDHSIPSPISHAL